MNKKYSITIKDLETGKTLVNDETNAIIGSYKTDETSETASMLYTDCNGLDLICILTATEKLIKKVFNDNPALFLKRFLLDAIEKANEDEEGGETE